MVFYTLDQVHSTNPPPAGARWDQVLVADAGMSYYRHLYCFPISKARRNMHPHRKSEAALLAQYNGMRVPEWERAVKKTGKAMNNMPRLVMANEWTVDGYDSDNKCWIEVKLASQIPSNAIRSAIGMDMVYLMSSDEQLNQCRNKYSNLCDKEGYFVVGTPWGSYQVNSKYVKPVFQAVQKEAKKQKPQSANKPTYAKRKRPTGR